MSEGFYYVDDRKLYASSFELKWIDQYLGNPDDVKVILDFGAFDLGDSYRFKRHCKNAEIYAIEACPERYKIIKDFALKNDIHCFNLAISDINGEAEFTQCLDPNEHELKYGPAGSLLKRTSKHTNQWRHLSYPDPIKVNAVTLDKFCNENFITDIDLCYIDIEGMELRALKGLTVCDPKLVYVECHLGKEWYGPEAYEKDEMDIYLVNRGYKMVEDTGTDRLYLKD